MARSYWNRVLARRLDRRRVLAATGTMALGTALLAACGGDKDGTEDVSGLLTKPVDTTAKAVPGGIWPVAGEAPNTLDPHRQSGRPKWAGETYSQLLRHGLAAGKRGPIAGDVAESWEFSPDGLTLTMKLRQNMKFDPRPPTSGRTLTTADVQFSWDRTIAVSAVAGELDNGVNPGAPIKSLATPDDKTIVIKLAFPYLSVLNLLATDIHFYVMPQEADGKFDARGEARGSGPFFLEKWTPSVGVDFKKNPDWYEKGRPFLDGIVEFEIVDYSARLAQFEAGSLWAMSKEDSISQGVRQEDVLRLKRDHPTMVLGPAHGGGPTNVWRFSQRPDSPLRDVRLRQAASMLIDRDLWIDAIFNVAQFRDAGLPAQSTWHSHISADYPEWLDPKGKELGEGAKYFQYNPAEAKKLIAAAGYDARPVSAYSSNQEQDRRRAEPIWGMLREGFNLNERALDQNTEYRDVCTRSGGLGFDGFCLTGGSQFSAQAYIDSVYTPSGRFAITKEALPVFTDLSNKIKSDLDASRQVEFIKEFQRQAALLWPAIHVPGFAESYKLNWSWLENYGVWGISQQTTMRPYVYFWYNKAKDPKAKPS